MFQNYYIYKGKRYGVLNEVKTPLGNLPVLLWNMVKGTFISFGIWLALDGVAWVTDSEFFEFLGMLICLSISLYVAYLYVCYNRCEGVRKNRTCLYCTTSTDEMERHIAAVSEKKPCFRESVDVITDDGWYMLFSKVGKEQFDWEKLVGSR